MTLLLVGCSGPSSLLDPKGVGARTVTSLWWLLFWIALVVLVVVVGMLIYSMFNRGRSGSGDGSPNPVPEWGHRFVIWSGFLIPAVILFGVFGTSLGDLSDVNRAPSGDEVRVEVIGHMWWWEARYDNEAAVANEIHIPVGEPVEFVLTSADVIHSFWVPSLHPKRDMVPGKENTIVLEADEAGRYRGVCAEFCGLQHANMALYVVADPEFDSWVADQAQQATEPAQASATGEAVFLGSTCVGCHTIRGTDADASAGPDLTHVASRETLFAGRVENTRENLSEIITDPQAVKPGTIMPPTQLEPDDLVALLDYLESLE